MRSRLQAVSEEEISSVEVEPVAQTRSERALTGLLMVSLRSLSQRAIVALSSLVDLLLLSSVFALLLIVISAPSTAQLIAVAGYAIFTLGALFMRRRNP